MAERLLRGYEVVSEHLPNGFDDPTATKMLLRLFLSEEDGTFVTSSDIALPADTNSNVRCRWLNALKHAGLVREKDGYLALTDDGYTLVDNITEAVWDAQRFLD